MIKPEMVPEEAIMKAALERWGVNQPTKWEKDTCRIIIAAALNAWPDMEEHVTWVEGKLIHVILPLPQENPDE